MGRRRPRTAFAASTLAGAAMLVGGCGGSGGSDPDGAALSDAFETRAVAAYDAQDLDRDQDFPRGALVDDCFAVDDEGADRVGAAVTGGDDVVAKPQGSNFLSGPPGEEERIVCGFNLGTEEDPMAFTINAGTTLVDGDGLRERLLRQEGATEIDGEAPDLDAANVVAIEVEQVNDGVAPETYAWVSDDFVVAPPSSLATGSASRRCQSPSMRSRARSKTTAPERSLALNGSWGVAPAGPRPRRIVGGCVGPTSK